MKEGPGNREGDKRREMDEGEMDEWEMDEGRCMMARWMNGR